MKKYIWVVDNCVKNKSEFPILVDEEFNDIIKMKIKCSKVTRELKEKLKEHGIETYTRTDEAKTQYCELIPIALEQIFYSAPLYAKFQDEYRLISTFFSGKAYAPRDFEAIKEEYEKCKNEMENEKE